MAAPPAALQGSVSRNRPARRRRAGADRAANGWRTRNEPAIPRSCLPCVYSVHLDSNPDDGKIASLRDFFDVIQRKKLDHTGAFDYFWGDGASKFVLGSWPTDQVYACPAMVLGGEAWRASLQELYQSTRPPPISRSESAMRWAN
jgi:hypothetical protein